MVHHLEERLGVKLIDRSKRPFVLTAEGEVYYEGCRKLVQQLCALEEEVRSLHHEVSGRVNVASIYSVGLSYMNDFVREFKRRNPKAVVHLDYQLPERVYELVERGQADLGLVSYPRSTRTLKMTSWRDEPMVLVCAPSHPLAQTSRVPLERLDGMEMIGFDRDLSIRHEIDRSLAAEGVSVEVVMEFDNIETLKRAIEINSGFSLLPEPTVSREVAAGSLCQIPLEGPKFYRPVGILQRRGGELGKTARRFLQQLIEYRSTNGAPTDGRGALLNHITKDARKPKRRKPLRRPVP